MPPDTIYIPGVTGPPPPLQDTLVDSFELYQQQLRDANEYRLDSLVKQHLKEEASRESSSGNDGIFILLLMAFIGLFFVRLVRTTERGKRKQYKRDPVRQTNRVIPCDEWLAKYNPYYNSLSSMMKERFVERTLRFMQEKEFRFHSMVEEEYIPVLVSGAAVQMTFGLANYQMDYFPVIHIIRKEYVLNVDQETYYGHVSKSGIYISWSSFLEGYSDYADSVNVGLHEMAHAVSYDLFLGEQDRHDEAFMERLKGFTKIGTTVFRAMKGGADHILDEYALTNFDEFWAVSIETFFENPEEFQRTLPDLYQSLCVLLNQNPLKPEKIVDPELAGLAI
ncbi:MAG TPA: zinc-dependent peptidase, partial [Chitinophagaceae bacterium]|jgi:Mlc titration factor MtfA (ptsG expression regulator)|nr:zinc-dependent peptidase [Chitinophagaceae bacterium]